MITCPECGQAAPDDARFCDRCGQGLAVSAAPPAPSLTPLAPGTTLKHGYRIVGLVNQTSRENRYRAERAGTDGIEKLQLREQRGPSRAAMADDEPGVAPVPEHEPANADPAGPRAAGARSAVQAS